MRIFPKMETKREINSFKYLVTAREIVNLWRFVDG